MLHLLLGRRVHNRDSSLRSAVARTQGVDKLATSLEVGQTRVAIGHEINLGQDGSIGQGLLDQAVERHVRHKGRVGGGADGGPAGSLLALDLDLVLQGRGAGAVDVEDDAAEAGVGDEEVGAAGDLGRAKEGDGAVGRRLDALVLHHAVGGDGEGG